MHDRVFSLSRISSCPVTVFSLISSVLYLCLSALFFPNFLDDHVPPISSFLFQPRRLQLPFLFFFLPSSRISISIQFHRFHRFHRCHCHQQFHPSSTSTQSVPRSQSPSHSAVAELTGANFLRCSRHNPRFVPLVYKQLLAMVTGPLLISGLICLHLDPLPKIDSDGHRLLSFLFQFFSLSPSLPPHSSRSLLHCILHI